MEPKFLWFSGAVTAMAATNQVKLLLIGWLPSVAVLVSGFAQGA